MRLRQRVGKGIEVTKVISRGGVDLAEIQPSVLVRDSVAKTDSGTKLVRVSRIHARGQRKRASRHEAACRRSHREPEE